jgi:hypothetical protein
MKASPFLALSVLMVLLVAPVCVNGQGEAPRLGRYAMLAFNPNTFRVGSFELMTATTYRGNGGREGTYRFDGNAIAWLSGPHRDEGYLGEFRTTRDGKTHRITLMRRAGQGTREILIGTNSID